MLTYIEHADDVIAFDFHSGSGFSSEARHDIPVARVFLEEELQGDATLQLGVSRSINDPHPSTTKRPVDAVLPADQRAGCELGVHEVLNRKRLAGARLDRYSATPLP
jgi:hypothetical protein